MENENTVQAAGIKYSIAMVAIGLILQFLTTAGGGAVIGVAVGIKLQAAGAGMEQIKSTAQQVVQNNLQYLALLGIVIAGVGMIWMGLRKRKEKLKELVLNNKEQINIKLLGILAVVAVNLALFSSEIMSMIMSLSNTPASELENINKLMQGRMGLLIGLLIAPVIEEIVFRGIILDSIATRHSRKMAVAVSAVLFSIYHFNIFQLLPSFLVGLLLGYIYLETKSVIVCICTHFMYNLIPLAFNQFQSTESGVPEIAQMDYVIAVVSVLVLLGGIKLLDNYFQDNLEVVVEKGNVEQENY